MVLADAILAFSAIMVIGLASLTGVIFLSMKERTLDRLLLVLVAFATGTIVATSFFDLLPEAMHHLEELVDGGLDIDEGIPFTFAMLGFLSFFILERFVYWFHGHAHQDDDATLVCHGNMPDGMDAGNVTGRVKNFAILNLVGDGLHNFLDGIIITVSFLSGGLAGGLVVTFAVLFHELPQEIGDFGILMYGGFSKKRALALNFLSAMIAVVGGIFAILLSEAIETFNMFFLAFSAGGFIYISAAELLPELLKERNLKKTVIQALILILGVIMIYLLVTVLPHD